MKIRFACIIFYSEIICKSSAYVTVAFCRDLTLKKHLAFVQKNTIVAGFGYLGKYR